MTPVQSGGGSFIGDPDLFVPEGHLVVQLVISPDLLADTDNETLASMLGLEAVTAFRAAAAKKENESA